jgi:hypothetical protein
MASLKVGAADREERREAQQEGSFSSTLDVMQEGLQGVSDVIFDSSCIIY